MDIGIILIKGFFSFSVYMNEQCNPHVDSTTSTTTCLTERIGFYIGELSSLNQWSIWGTSIFQAFSYTRKINRLKVFFNFTLYRLYNNIGCCGMFLSSNYHLPWATTKINKQKTWRWDARVLFYHANFDFFINI